MWHTYFNSESISKISYFNTQSLSDNHSHNNVCSECKDGYILKNKRINGHLLENNAKCEEIICPDECNECSDHNTCTNCKDNYKLTNNSCCLDTCKEC